MYESSLTYKVTWLDFMNVYDSIYTLHTANFTDLFSYSIKFQFHWNEHDTAID